MFFEQGWVTTNLGHIRRRFIIKTALYIGLLAGTAATAALWVNSYTQNKALIVATQRDVGEYRELAAPFLNQAQIADGDLGQVLPLLQKLRFCASAMARMTMCRLPRGSVSASTTG